MNMLMSFAEFEREMIAERTRDKIAGARRKEVDRRPRALRLLGEGQEALINDVEAHVVREAFTLFLQHRQMAVVARELNRRGLQPARRAATRSAACSGRRTASPAY